MAQIIRMPKLSDTMEEGGIAKWLKKEGDKIKEGEPLVEIETDKATMEFSSPESGVLLKIIATPGLTVALNAPICAVGKAGESFQISSLEVEKTKDQEVKTPVKGDPSVGQKSSPSQPGKSSPEKSSKVEIPKDVFIIRMPKLSDTMLEGGISKWLKSEGDQVKEGEALVEIETDKAALEFSSPESGTLLKILAVKGSATPLDAPICILGKKGTAYNPSWISTDFKPVQGSSLSSSPASSSFSPSPSEASIKDVANSEQEKSLKVNSSGQKSYSLTNRLRVKASPLAKRIAESQGMDLRGKVGTGPNGRVIVRDLDSLSGQNSTRTSIKVREDHKVPLTMMRKTIAKRLLQGKNEAPHFYLKQSASMEQMLDWREKLNKDREAKKLARISVNDMMILAVSRALKDHPGVNASWQGDYILEFGQINIAMAVALPGGLVTPVIRNADQLSLGEISSHAKELGLRAKEGKLTNDDYVGGTFTISNLGMTGIEEFTAIINPPQAAILAIGKTMTVPWVKPNGELGVQSRVNLTLSCDHRVIDGMVGALFMETLVKYLETPILMFS
jgi:pyruvate dehydrogenase E2 component (dihydrolipoamide acetyltransferase)